MRATTLTALTILTLASPLFAIPIPPPMLGSHDRALSSIYRPSPHLLPINAPHTPVRPSLPISPSADSKWSFFTSRKGAPESSSQSADNVSPKELSQHWSEARPPSSPSSLSSLPSISLPRAPSPHSTWIVPSARIGRPCHDRKAVGGVPPRELAQHWSGNRPAEVVESTKSWRIIRYRITTTCLTHSSLSNEQTLEYVLWILSACLIVAMGVELVSLWRAKPVSEANDKESRKCRCGKEVERTSEKSVGFETEKHINENGLERSSW